MMSRASRIYFSLFTIAILSLSSAYAATFTVNTTADAVDANIGDGVCATATGFCSLRAAIQEANSTAAPDAINLPDGHYMLTELGNGEDASATGDLDVTQTLTINGTSKDGTIVDGILSDTVFHIFFPATFSANNLTIQNGDGSNAGAIDQSHSNLLTLSDVFLINNYGGSAGALYSGGPVTITNSMFSLNASSSSYADIFIFPPSGNCTISNSSFMDGPGTALYISGECTTNITNSTFTDYNSNGQGIIYISTGTGPVNVSNCEFSSNVSTSDSIFYYSGSSSVTITDTVFKDNNSSFGIAGAVYVSTGSGNLNVDGCTFMNNSAGSGPGDIYFSGSGDLNYSNSTSTGSTCVAGASAGALDFSGQNVNITNVSIDGATCPSCSAGGVYLSGGGSATIQNSSITNSSIVSGSFGGLFVSMSSSVTIEDTTIAGNVLYSGGSVGGAYLSAGGPVTIDRSTFFDNFGRQFTTAGALYCSSGANCNIINSTFSHNTGYTAGAYYVSSPGIINNSTFLDNEATDFSGSSGAALYVSGPTQISNSIIAGASLQPLCDVPGTLTSNGFNIEGTNTCGFTNTGDLSNTDPLLSQLTMIGLTTKSTSTTQSSMLHVPLANSPAIDAGDNVTCETDDQRGATRPFDGDQDGTATCDIGSVEFNDFCPEDDTKQFPGTCGCGTPDVDTDNDGTLDCNESCDNDPSKTSPGQCGCGVPEPGQCGCGVPETDSDGDGTPDCLASDQVTSTVNEIDVEANRVKCSSKKKVKKEARQRIATLLALVANAESVSNANASSLVFAAGADLTSFVAALNKLEKRLKKLRKSQRKEVKVCKKARRQMRKANTQVQANKPTA